MLVSSKIIVFCFGFSIGYYLCNIIENVLLPIEKSTGSSSEKLLLESNLSFDIGNLFNIVKVTCIVFVKNPKNAYFIHNTWGRKCNSIMFYSKVHDNFIQTHVIAFSHKWQYFCDVLRHVWSRQEDLQWALFSPDDVFVIPENLRYMVATKDPDVPHYFGHNVVFWQQLYNSDKTSFVLSKGAIQALIKKFNSSSACAERQRYMNDAVFNLGRELSLVGISAEDGRDEAGRERFHIFTMEQLMATDNQALVASHSRTSLRPVRQGKECCSRTSVSFRSVQNDKAYFLFYLLYTVEVGGAAWGALPANHPQDLSRDYESEVWQRFVLEELGAGANFSAITSEMYFDLWRNKVWEPEELNRKIREDILLKIHSFI